MRILQVNKLYSPWIGGIESVAKSVAEHLNHKENTVVTNLVCQPRGRRKVEQVNGVTTYRAASMGMLSGMPLSIDFFLLFWRLAQTADLIILHHPFPLGIVAFRCLADKKKVIVWYHSDIVKQTLSRIPFQPFIRYALKKAASVIVSNKAIVENSPFLRAVGTKCKVIYFGINLKNLNLDVERRKKVDLLREEYGSPLVLSVGRLVYYKGYEYLIDAMNEVPNARLIIIGNGKLREQLETQIARNGLVERVHILGPVDDLAPYYHSCDLFVLPSCEPSEVFGLVQIEALACGKPVINTSLPTGVPEVSVNGKTGRTVPPKSASALATAIREILADGDEYTRYSQHALNAVIERFTEQRFLADFDTAIGADQQDTAGPENSHSSCQ